jgi:hypothetical protein
MLTNHCLYSELTALIRANRLFDMEHGDDWINRDTLAIPYLVHRGVDRIAEVFQRVKSGDYNGAIQHAKAGKVSLSMFESGPDNEDNVGR